MNTEYIRVTRGNSYYEINVEHLKGISMTKSKKHLSNIPEDIVEKAHIKVNGKPKKKSKTETSNEEA